MKKTNNKYRNNSNQIYSLNYKFDSISIAGKISGTALDLIKKYNELAKEAHANGDYVTAEVFRQYAEHYRKIVTEINEKKSAQKVVNFPKNDNMDITDGATSTEAEIDIDTKASDEAEVHNLVAAELEAPIDMPATEKKEFTVIEISEEKKDKAPMKTRGRHTVRKKSENQVSEPKAEDVAV